MNVVTPLSTSTFKSSSKNIDNNTNKNSIGYEKLLAKKKIYRIFNSIKDVNCYDEKSCDNLQKTFEYLQNDCYDAFDIDPHQQSPRGCSAIQKHNTNAKEKFDCLSKKYGGKKSKTKKSKTKKNKTKKSKK
jgi:hypothetical protein